MLAADTDSHERMQKSLNKNSFSLKSRIFLIKQLKYRFKLMANKFKSIISPKQIPKWIYYGQISSSLPPKFIMQKKFVKNSSLDKNDFFSI